MKRFLAAVAVGLAGALFIWVAVPYNNFVLGNSYISDDYMPTAALFVLLITVLLVNPLLRRLHPGLALDRRQLAVVFGILLVACITPSQGLLREFPYALAGTCKRVSADKGLAAVYKAVNPPRSLFPDPLEFGADTPVSSPFLDQLAPGQPLPWKAWLRPMTAWLGFLFPWWLMMTAMAVILLPQWRDNERLAFPLLGVQNALIDVPEKGGMLPGIFRNRLFWIGTGVVFLLHLMAGLNRYYPQRVPAIPLEWNLSPCFTEAPLMYLPWYIKSNRFYFIFLGLAYFMPNRIGFSIWFFQVIYAAYIVIGRAYNPPFHYETITDHRIGAFFAVPLWILWLGRRQWARVFRSLVVWDGTAENARNRWSALAFLTGIFGMAAWLVWVHVQAVWIPALILLAVFYALAITRIVAETGLPLIAPDTRYTLTLIQIVPLAWRTAATTYFSAVVGFFVGHGNRLCCTTMMLHALGLNREAGPRRQVRLASLFLAVVVFSVAACGAVHLWATYHHSMTLDGRESPISAWGTWILGWNAERLTRNFVGGVGSNAARLHMEHIGFGAALAAILYWLCQWSPKWPLHPVALLFVTNWYAHHVWFNVFLGWTAKVLILRYGGSRLYRSARPVFVGLVMGEVFAMAFWAVVTGVLGALGQPYHVVEILPF